jgi:tetratricopeptide (TPR) repeat protein
VKGAAQLGRIRDAKPSYDAFVSYSHADSKLAKRLEEELESYRPPKDLLQLFRPLNVFRDEDDIQAASDLSEELRRHIASSRYLIVLCSPEARKSHHVNAEITEFIRLHGQENILCALVNGRPNREVAPADPNQDQAFPDALIESGIEPLAADFRKSHHWFPKLGREEKLKIIAPILGVERHLLAEREKERRSRRRRRLLTGLAALTCLVLASGFWLAYTSPGQLYGIQRAGESYVLKGGIDGDARTTWALAQIASGNNLEARRTLDIIPDASQREQAFAKAAQAWFEKGKSELAQEAITSALQTDGQVSDRSQKIDNEILIGKIGAKIHNYEAERAIAVASGRTIFMMDDLNEFVDKRILISEAWRSIGEEESADDVLDGLPELIANGHGDKSVANRYLAIAFAVANKFEEAEKTVNDIRDPFQQAFALIGISDALIPVHQSQKAELLLNRAARVSTQIRDGYFTDQVNSLLVKAYLKIQQRTRAAQIAKRIPNGIEKLRAAVALCDAGAADDALAMIKHPVETRDDVWIAIQAAAGFARNGDFSKARALAESNPDPSLRSDPEFSDFAMSEVAIVMAEKGKLADAEELSAKITDAYRKSRSLARVASLYAQSNQRSEFLRIRRQVLDNVPKIADSSRRSEVFKILAEAELQVGERSQAVAYLSEAAEAAVLIHDPMPRFDALNALVELALKHGMLRKAVNFAAMHPEDSRKVECYGKILLSWRNSSGDPRPMIVFY